MSDVTFTNSDENTVFGDLGKTMSSLYNLYVKNDAYTGLNPPVLNTIATPPASMSNAFSASNLCTNVLCWNFFQKAYAESNGSTLPLLSTDADTTHIWSMSNGSTYSVSNLYNLSNLVTVVDGLTDFEKSNVHVYHALLDTNRASVSNLAYTLRDIHIAYQLLDESVFAEVNLTKQWPQTKTITSLEISSTNKLSALANTGGGQHLNDIATEGHLFHYIAHLDPKKQDIFAFRRLVLGVYLVAHIYIAMTDLVYAQTITNADEKAKAVAASKALSLFYFNRLQRLNKLYETSSINNNTNSQGSTLSKNINRYDELSTRLADIDQDLRLNRGRFKNEAAQAAAARSDAAKMDRMRMVSIAFACIFVVALFGVFVLPLEFAARMKIAAVLGVVALVVAVILMRVGKNIAETFEGSLGGLTAGTVFAKTAAETDTTNLTKLMNIVIMEQFRDYLSYTADATMFLRTNRLYDKLSSSMNKERAYFETTNEQLARDVAKSKNAARTLDRRARIMAALVTFIMQLVVIVIFTIVGAVALAEVLPGLRIFVFIVGGVLALLSLVVFLADVLGRTHIDGQKQYWGTPEMVKNA